MNDKTFELKNIIRSVRQQGSTTYLLNAAINNPDVTIIVANQSQAKQLEAQYLEKLNSLSWWKKFFRKISGKDAQKPKFIPVRNSRDVSINRTPVIIDLYAVASSL
jgi:hypothetical protein